MDALIIGIVVVSVIVGLLWWIAIFFFIGKGIKAVLRQLEQETAELEALLNQVPQNGFDNLTAAQQSQILGLLTQTHQHFGQLNSIHQQRYEARVGDLMSTAASAGIDWSPGSY